MTRYLLDTNAMGDFLNHRYDVPARAQAARKRGVVIGTCEPVVAELYFGVENSETRKENLARLERGLRRIKCWPLTRQASAEYGRLALALKRTGRVVGQIDILIAAIAISLGDCTVVSSDKDMVVIPGLLVENWRGEEKGG
jgi:tRNA(fMet)-specific endonuclease VapC